MKIMSATEFKARCLKVVDEVQATGEGVIITKRGRPVAKLVRATKASGEVFGRLVGKVEIVGDIESSLAPPEIWEALK